MTTVASGFCTSAPAPVASAIGTKPSEATSAVITTGRSLASAPALAASARFTPSAINCWIDVTITSPLSTAIPTRQ